MFHEILANSRCKLFFRWERASFLSGGYPMGGISFGEGVFEKIVRWGGEGAKKFDKVYSKI